MEHIKKCGNNQAFDSVNTRPTHRVRSQIAARLWRKRMVPNPKRCKTRMYLISWCVQSMHWINYKTGGVGDRGKVSEKWHKK